MARAREHWTGRVGFILATVGSAVGLGSIWKFPYELGANGGGAFLLFYLLGLALVVAPLMLAEMAIGRRGGLDAVASISQVARGAGASLHWSAVGGLGVLTSCAILTYYSVIGGWAIAYASDLGGGVAAGADLAAVRRQFEDLLSQPLRVALLHTLFMLVISLIVARGIAAGIETALKVMMPAMLLLIAGLAVYAMISGDWMRGLAFLFVPDFSRLTPRVAMEALGLGFFSIGVGLACLMTYAAYADRTIDLVQAAVATLVADTVISLAAGMAVFPLVFAHGLDPADGPGLVFVVLPLAFSDMPYGRAASLAFFACLTVAAIASAVSLLEMPVAYLRRVCGWSRGRSTATAAAVCWIGGLATVLSFGPWAAWRPLAGINGLGDASLFDLIDGAASNVMLPASGLGLALFAGWVLPSMVLSKELRLDQRWTRWLSFTLRFIVPACIVMAALAPLLRAAR